MTEKEYWFWLYSQKGIGKAKREKLLNCFGTAEGIFKAEREMLASLPGLTAKDMDTLTCSKDVGQIKKEYEGLLKKGIYFFTKKEQQYPESLRHIYDSPDALYVRGRFPEKEKVSIAIVGARDCSNYGKEMALHFGRQLSKGGIQVISGLARGIDSFAHWGAIEAGKATYGVLGCGIDRCYPAENLELFMRIQEKGGILSEFGPGVLPRAGNFPLRNRVISGLCHGILVIEAREKSGSLITAHLGLDQGKDIFALPGRGGDILSKGCNSLIKQGAFLADSPEDILEFYQIQPGKNGEEREKGKKSLDLKWEMVYSCLSLEPKPIGSIMEESKLSLADTMEVLLSMEAKGYIKRINRNDYALAMN